MRVGLERAVQATETLVEGIDNAGIPDTPQGEEAAEQVSEWADAALDDLEEAQDVARRGGRHARGARSSSSPRSSRTLGSSLAGGVQAIADVARVDPELAAALRDSSTCDELREETGQMSTTDWILIALEGLVVIGFIALGVRSGGVGLGLWGGVGTLVLVFLFGLDPGEPPISAMLIIIAVIAASAAMQAAGGIDYMVLIASRALRARPKALNFVAPYVSWLLTILTGTGNTFFSLIPVINELAYANKIRPERALAGSAVASTFGITASPVAAAMATMLPLVEPFGYDIVDVMLITIPASFVGIFAMALRDERARQGAGRRRGVPAPPRRGRDRSRPRRPGEITLLPYAKRSVAIFLTAVAAICIFGVFEGLRPTIAAEGGGTEPLSVTPIIQMFMLTAAALILILAHVQATDIPNTHDLQVGHGRDDRPLRHRLDGRHVHRQQRGRDRDRARQPRRELAVHDRRRDLPRRRADDEPVRGDADDGPARARARDRGRLHDRDVDGRRRRALLPGERDADRRRRGRRDGLDDPRQARGRPLLPAAAADRVGRHRASWAA